MRWILLALLGTVCWINSSAYGQNPSFQREILQNLEKLQVYLDPGEGIASVHSSESDTLKALALLRQIKKLRGIRAQFGNSKHSEECMKEIAKFSDLTFLQLKTDHLTNDDLSKIANLMQLEVLSLNYPGITDAQIQQLHALRNLKNLKELHLTYRQASPKALAELKGALPGVKDFIFQKDLTMQTVDVLPKDGQLLKLRKEKLNAAIAEFNIRYRLALEGQRSFGDHAMFEAAKQAKDAAIELGDSKISMQFAENYLEMAERIHQEAENRLKAGKDTPQDYYRVRYYYVDAQIHHLQTKRQMEAK